MTPALVSIVIPVYRDAERAIALVHALQQQRLPPGLGTETILVDDGSGDGSGDRSSQAIGDSAIVHRLPANVGRAVARNAGAAIATGAHILFMDCDCLPADDGLVAGHLAVWDEGVAASTGPVEGTGHGFWHRYQSAASVRRARQHDEGAYFSGSSQNLMVLKAAFERCGGFDSAYRGYGFEDRDLLLRIGLFGDVRWASRAAVRHMDALELPAVCRKMAEAGRDTAPLFRARHPEAYRRLGHAAIDAGLHPWLRPLARVLGPLVLRTAPRINRWLAHDRLPYPLGAAVVKIASASSFLYGTSRRNTAA